MRYKQIFELLSTYDFSKAYQLASLKTTNGGWEVWFQVEFAHHLSVQNKGFFIEREYKYPNSVLRCDFLIFYNGYRDPTYIELKCINPYAKHPQTDALNRYRSDLYKPIPDNLPVGFMLLFFGDHNDVRNLVNHFCDPLSFHILYYNAIVGLTSIAKNINDLDASSDKHLYIIYHERLPI